VLALPVTIIGETDTGDALQWDGSAWSSVIDVGPQDFPFLVEGAARSGPIPVPDDLRVAHYPSWVTYFWCDDPDHPPLPENEDFVIWWRHVLAGLFDEQGYNYQVFRTGSCVGTPFMEGEWAASNPDATAYGTRIAEPSAGSYCYHVRAWEDYYPHDGKEYSNWSPCCCFDVGAFCTALATPTITGVGDTTCGGTTLETSPLLRWEDVADESGYRWEVRTSAGALVNSGTAGKNIPVAPLGTLDPGSYIARLQAYGDGEIYCDSGWTGDCAFEVAHPACETLATPAVTGVGDTSCGGATTETSPLLSWGDIANESGYMWELRNAAGTLVNSGTAGENATTANLGTLDPGTYSARVQAYGDGIIYCDGDWSTSCSFEVLGEVGTTDFTWWPEQPKQGQRVRFADLSIGMPRSWFWQMGDGWTSTEQNPTHAFDGAGNFNVSLEAQFDYGEDSLGKTITVSGIVRCGDDVCEGGETAWSCPADCALEPEETGRAGGSDQRPTVPAAVGGVGGVGGTFWMTEGWVFNPGDETVKLVFEYTPRGEETVLTAGPFDLDPQRGLYWDNIVEELFDTTGVGMLWLDSTEPVHFLTRSYNLTDMGTFGQGVPGIRERLTIGQGDGEVYLIGLREDASFRSNLFFQEVDGAWVTVHVAVFNDSGERLRRANVYVGGHSGKLKSLASLGVADEESVYATVQVTEGDGRVGVIGSVVDQITGDPTTVDPIHLDQLAVKAADGGKDSHENHQLVAVVAHTEGEAGSVWRTKVVIKNPTSSGEQTVRLVYQPEYDQTGVVGDSMEKTWTIRTGRQKRWKDVLVDLFELPASAKTQGALHVYSPERLVIRSRTFNERPGGGTFGQDMKALARGDLIDSEKAGTIIGLKHTPGTRTNIGITEFSGEETEVVLTFCKTFLEDFCYPSLPPFTVAASSHLQVTKVFEKLGLGDAPLHGIMAYVTVKRGGSVYAYASSVDNASGDATTITTAKK